MCTVRPTKSAKKKKKIRKPGHALPQLSKMQRKFFGLFQKLTDHILMPGE